MPDAVLGGHAPPQPDSGSVADEEERVVGGVDGQRGQDGEDLFIS